MSFSLGLDVGITSVGWSVIDHEQNKLIEFGSRIFPEAIAAQERRSYRSQRRNLRRKKWRKQQLKNVFVEYGLLSQSEVEDNDFISFTYRGPKYRRSDEETVYHVRKKGLSKQLSTRELFLSLYNIAQTRGHFLLENVDFRKGSITYEMFKENFEKLMPEYVVNNQDKFEIFVLKPLFEKGGLKRDELKKAFAIGYTADEANDEIIKEMCKLLSGQKADMGLLDPLTSFLDTKKKVTKNIEELSKMDEPSDRLQSFVDLYDMGVVARILNDYDYICEMHVAHLNGVHDVYRELDYSIKGDKQTSERYKEIRSKMKLPSTGLDHNYRVRVIKNVENKFPNGLYIKEANDILKCQQKYDERITDDFIAKCLSILSARIPFYVGPLSENAKNAWLVKKGNFKYSYEMSKDVIDLPKTVKNWKDRMRSHCTYLPDEFALPKASFVGETFAILNELNILTAKTKDGEECFLTELEKLRLFNELFLRVDGDIKHKQVAEVLDLGFFGPANGSDKGKFTKKYTVYRSLIKILPELELDTITELFSNHKKVDRIEKIILDLNLFDDEMSRFNNFIGDNWKFDEEIARSLSKLNTKDFGRLSYRFLMETPMDQMGTSLMSLLFEDNTPDFKNEQMTRITNAVDLEGNPQDFLSNKYMKLFKQGAELDVNLLLDEDKPVVPISRPVLRGINETLKIYKAILSQYGIPNRVVIEMARELTDVSKKGKAPQTHASILQKTIEEFEEKLKDSPWHNNLEKWEDIVPYLQKNRNKVELYVRQNGIDLLSGKRIDLNNLDEYEIDHILPRGFGNDSLDNKMLIHRTKNTIKADRVPLEFLSSSDNSEQNGHFFSTQDFIDLVHKLYRFGLISKRKVNMLLLETSEQAAGFISRNLVDTRYITKELFSILNAYNIVNGYQTKLVALKAGFTSQYRKVFGMKKHRDFGVQHHAHDAAIVSIADHVLSTYFPNYDQRGNFKRYQEFMRHMENVYSSELKNKNRTVSNLRLNQVIENAFEQAYGCKVGEYESIVSQVRRKRPLYSQKVVKKSTGKFFDATRYKPADKKAVLSILGVNNDKRSFSSVECAATDFYRYEDKKGRIKFVAIHIPLVIINHNGTINQDQYKKLVIDHYGVPELYDENGKLRTENFLFRVFKNDLIYDTYNKQIAKFNIGSVTKKNLEYKECIIYSYNEIDELRISLTKDLTWKFDLFHHSYNRGGTVKIDDSISSEIMNYLNVYFVDFFGTLNRDSFVSYLESKMKDKNLNVWTFDELMYQAAFAILMLQNPYVGNTFGKRQRYVINSFGKAVDNHIEFVKLKYSPLGIRYYHDENGGLVIEGPASGKQKVKRIRKEPFYWTIK